MILKTKFFLLTSMVLFIGSLSCTTPTFEGSTSSPIQHDDFDILLKKYVNEAGYVDYKGFIADSLKLNSYLDMASKHHPNSKNWSKDEQLAFWINVYNASTIQLIIRHYPIKSIKDIAGIIPFVNSPWDVKFIHIEGQTYDLNNIEHNIIRKDFDEPRIHFALVCAAISCPKLRNEAYQAGSLDAQLEDQARAFFNNSAKNKISPKSVQLSKLLDWYGSDFTKDGNSLISVINQYSDVKVNASAEISYLSYSWDLNEQ